MLGGLIALLLVVIGTVMLYKSTPTRPSTQELYPNYKNQSEYTMGKVEVIMDEKFPVNEIGPNIKIGQRYLLKEEYICKCGEIHYNIGLSLEVNYVECYKCREKLQPTNHWCHSSRFLKIK